MSGGKLVLFDLDNTLIDRQDAYRSWVERFVHDEGLDATTVELMVVLDHDGFASREEVFGPVAARFPALGSTADLVERYRATYPSCISPVPAVVAELDRLSGAGWSLGLVTNGPPTQHVKIERSGLGGVFDAVCVSDEVGVEKPDRRIFALAAKGCGAELTSWPKRWMVGDAPGPDIGGGLAAGLRTIWMSRGRTWQEPSYRPDASAESVHDVVEILLAQ